MTHLITHPGFPASEVYLDVPDALDAEAVDYLRERTLSAFGETDGRVVLDCSFVRHIEPRGLCFLLEMTRIGRVRGVDLVLAGASDHLRLVLVMAGLLDSVHLAGSDATELVALAPLPDRVGPPIRGFPVARMG